MRFTVRDLVYIGVFGALWGTMEITSGSILHVFNVPFSGAMLSAVGIAIALIGRLFVPRPGSILFIGVVTAFLKMFSLGGIIIYPVIGIIAESVLGELVVTALGKPRLVSFVVGGAFATLWTLVHPLFTQGMLAGEGVLKVYLRTLDKGARALGLDPTAIIVVLVALVVLHLVIGSIAGFIAWDAGKVIQARLRPATREMA